MTSPDETEEAVAPSLETDATEDISALLAEEEFDLSGATGGRYVYRGEICTGGMGRVIRAWDTRLERMVAVKILRSSHVLKPDLSGRFVCEAKITANLIHPGVVPVYDVGCDARGRHFFVMQYVEGTTLAELIAKTHERDRVSSHAIHHLVGVFIRVCQTIGYAHHRGIVHRDLKPANVMVGNFGEVLVMDWGLAKCVSPDHWPALGFSKTDSGERRTNDVVAVCAIETTDNGPIRGTPRYMSPEQAGGPRSANLGPPSDVFSLGIILYEILTGEKPFVGGSVREILDAVRTGRYRPIHEVLQEKKRRPVPPEIQAVCEKAMALHPVDRYATARELAADMEAYYEHRAVSAYQESWHHRIRRWGRRYPVAATMLTVLLFGILAAAGVAGFYYYTTRQMIRPFLAQESAGEREYRAIRNEIQWLELQKTRYPEGAPEVKRLEKQIQKLARRRLLAADQILFARQRIFAVLRWQHDPEAYRKFRRFWLDEMISGIDLGEFDFVQQRYQQMQVERRRFPWWRWEPEEFPKLMYLRTRLQAHAGKKPQPSACMIKPGNSIQSSKSGISSESGPRRSPPRRRPAAVQQ